MRPQLADSIGTYDDLGELLCDDLWYASQKVDGHRRLVDVSDGQVRAFNRSGEPTSLPPLVTKVLASIQGMNVTLDGELVGNQVLWLFDLPRVGQLGPLPFFKRRIGLVNLSEQFTGPVRLLPVATTTDEKVQLATRLLDAKCEGVMLNQRNARYIEGPRRNPDVRKFKFTRDCDVHLTDRYVHGHDNFGMTVYDEAGKPVYVGEVTAQAGDGRTLQVGDVACVKYLYAVDPTKPKLFQPTLPRKRTDKPAAECSLDQLIYANKGVLA